MAALPNFRPTRLPRSPESFDSLHRRNAAAEILQSYEKLSWHSFQRCETLTQTRLHFQNIVAGFTPEDEEALVNWKEDFTPRQNSLGEDSRPGKKGKERVSTGSNASADKTSDAHVRSQIHDRGNADVGGERSVNQNRRKRKSELDAGQS